MKKQLIKQALLITAPTLLAYFPLGVIYGVLFTHADYPWYIAPLMSATIYAGAVQFVALSMMIEQASLIAILMATVFIAMRNSFYGLSVIERFKPAPLLKRFFLIFGLVDATYAIFSVKPQQEDDIDFCFYITLFPYLSWVIGTFLGAYFANWMPDIKGLDFILTSFFAILVIEYYLLNKKIDAILIPIILAFGSYWLIPQYYLLLAILGSALYLYVKLRVSQ